MRSLPLWVLALFALPAFARASERRAQATLVVPASVESVWRAFTTPDGLVQSLGAAEAKVQLRPGGSIETLSAGTDGAAAEWTVRRLLACEREAMLAFALQPGPSTPEPIAAIAGGQWSVLRLEPLASDRTEVTITTLARGEGEEFALAFASYEDDARGWVEAVQRSFDPEAAQREAERAWQIVRDWCGGEWLAEQPWRVRAKLTPILDGHFVLEETWIGDESALRLSARSVYGIDPRSRALTSWTYGADGLCSTSTLRLDGDAALLLRSLPPGAPIVTRVAIGGTDAHSSETRSDDGASLSTLQFRRVPELPEEWAATLSEAPLESPSLAPASQPTGPAELQRVADVVHASSEQLWQQMSSGEGLKKLWGVAQASIDLRIGGQILTHYDAAGTLGDERGIRHEILAFEPGRMLAFRTTPAAGAPQFLKDWCAHGWHVIRLEPLGPARTRMVVTGCDYGDDEASKQTRAFFERGNAFVLAGIQKQYSPTPDARPALERLAPLVGGAFDASGVVPPGQSIRAQTQWKRFSGPFLAWEGRLGAQDAAELPEHTLTIYGPDPAGGAARFWKFGADGSVARGELVLDGERGVGHDWHSHATSGQVRHIYVQLLPDEHGYLYRAQPSLSEGTTLVELRYRRR